ncbi:MAG TPA: RtcB family protein [Candidatus Nanopelagicales bacterium]|jgi:tRNA-splicing ligase RtcB
MRKSMDIRVLSAEEMSHRRSLESELDTPRVFDSRDLPADPEALGELRSATLGFDLLAPPVVLPDFHHKSNMEMPSSIAVATVGTIRPTLTSSSLNCGMALISLDCERPTDAAIGEFFRAVRERYPYPTRGGRELTRSEAVGTAVGGAQFAAARFGVDAAELERVEESGLVDLEPYGGKERLIREMPALAWHLSRLRFGTIGPTNHFVELQQVEEIIDEERAAALGVRLGQTMIQYHAGGGVMTGIVGHLFGRREDYARSMRAVMAVSKPLYHLRTARSKDQLQERLRLYFSKGCPPVELASDEGQRLMLANAAAMNYGFAFRLSTYAALQRLATRVFGGGQARLVVDSPHNSVYEEEVDGQLGVVHRHNSCRAYPGDRMPVGTTFARTGQAVLLPGTHRTSSYLAVAGKDSATSLHSACHGAGTVIDHFERSGLSTSDPQARSTMRFRYDDRAPTTVPHLDDKGVAAALQIMSGFGLVRPVARMRPMAVLH